LFVIAFLRVVLLLGATDIRSLHSCHDVVDGFSPGQIQQIFQDPLACFLGW
jgi:hypothetical protein